MKKSDAILCGDLHLRETIPVCRTDDFESAMWKKLDFISDLQKEHDCPVLCSGDLFHHWKPSPELLSKTSAHLPNNFICVYGQHDLPQHNLELSYKSGLYNLMTNGKTAIPKDGSWGWEPKGEKGFIFKDMEIIIWHHFAYKGKIPWPGCTSSTAKTLLKKYPQYDLILLGDNHIPFTETYEGRLLVNPGSMMRQSANQMDYKPAVWLWYAKTNTVKPVYLPIEEGVISREHIEQIEKRDNRIEAFVSRLNTEWDSDLSYEKNLELFFSKNRIQKNIKEIIIRSLE